MAKEIERKFLVNESLLPQLKNGFHISQGYVNTADNVVVRARIKNGLAFLTLKGESNGMTCSEFEYEIPLKDAEEIISELCSGCTIEKTRYEIVHENHLWEVDFFHGSNQGLIIAEVELVSEDEQLAIPNWVTEEVTGQAKYFNVSLIESAYSTW